MSITTHWQISDGHHVGYYLAGVGLLRTLERRWPKATARWDHAGLHIDTPAARDTVHDYLIDVANNSTWQAPCVRAQHPILGQWGRREPHRWQPLAREFLRTMPAEQRERELDWVLGAEDLAIQIARPSYGMGMSGVTLANYGLGTAFPFTVPHKATMHPGEQLSAWLAVLAWESWDWLQPPDSKHCPTLGKGSQMMVAAWSDRLSNRYRDQFWRVPDGLLVWHAVTWRRPIELHRLPVLWRGRAALRGHLWSDRILSAKGRALRSWELCSTPHVLRHTQPGAASAEAWPIQVQTRPLAA